MFLAVALVAASAASSAVVEHGSDRGQFALAGWASIDAQTGEEHFRMIVTSGPLGGPADVEYSGSDTYPVTCPDGTTGQRIVEASGLTTGALTVERNLGGASLVASVRMTTTTTFDLCEGFSAQPAVTHSVERIGFEVAGAGRRWTERTGTFIRIPSLQTAHEHARAVGRDATGTLSVGDVAFPLVFGDFGRITGTWHFSAHTEMAAARLRSVLPIDAVRAEGAMETGSLQRAGVTWERTGPHGYRGVFVGADRLRSGDSAVYMDGYTSSTIRCADGSSATREVIRSGEGPGRLEIRGHHGSAQAAGLLDVTRIVSDGCTGATTTGSRQGVVAELALTATGLTTRGSEWMSLHNPPGAPRRVFVAWSGRSAAGSLRVGAERHGSTTWGEIGTLRWRQQAASARAEVRTDQDFNGDGYADLAIGAPNRSLPETLRPAAFITGREGAVSVLYGSPVGLTPVGLQLWAGDTPGVPGAAVATGYLGFSLAAGGFDGDGYADLAVGRPGGLSGVGCGLARVAGRARYRPIPADRAVEPGRPSSVARPGEWFGSALLRAT